MKNLQLLLCGALIIANGALFTTASYADSNIQNPVTVETCHSFAWNLEAAKKGQSDAQYDLAMMYFNGDQVKTDHKSAQHWLNVAAQQNNVKAQYRLAMMAEMGIGTEKNNTEAFAWYLKAANQGHAKAQYKVADAYQTGTGIEKDQTQAKQWFEKAAQQGNTLALAVVQKS